MLGRLCLLRLLPTALMPAPATVFRLLVSVLSAALVLTSSPGSMRAMPPVATPVVTTPPPPPVICHVGEVRLRGVRNVSLWVAGSVGVDVLRRDDRYGLLDAVGGPAHAGERWPPRIRRTCRGWA